LTTRAGKLRFLAVFYLAVTSVDSLTDRLPVVGTHVGYVAVRKEEELHCANY
jgi:hypothetical protein